MQVLYDYKILHAAQDFPVKQPDSNLSASQPATGPDTRTMWKQGGDVPVSLSQELVRLRETACDLSSEPAFHTARTHS